MNHRVIFDLFFALCFLIGVHGANIIKILIILSLNYTIAKQLGGRKVLPWVTWVFNVGVLFLNEWFDGYQFRDIHDLAAPLVPFFPSTSLHSLVSSYWITLTVGRIRGNHASMADFIQYYYSTIDFLQHGLSLELYQGNNVGGTFFSKQGLI